MSKSKLLIWILGFLTVIISSFFYFSSNRFYISVQEEGISYKIDRWTGKTWLLNNDSQIEVNNTSDSDESSEAKVSTTESAIERVKSATTLDDNYPYLDNDFNVKNEIEKLDGEIRINGWKAEKIDDQIFLVWYEVIHNRDKKTVGFEYNSASDIIRHINDDQILEEKYKKYLEADVNTKSLDDKVDQLVADDQYEKALQLLNDSNTSESSANKLKEKIHLNYGLYLEYRGPENKSMRERMVSALDQYIQVLRLNSKNEKARSEIKQIMSIYESMPNQSPGEQILNQLRSLGFNY
ncbi:MAG: hypothetical protein U5K69_21805 [Balneolaceae bacterium]|nr:hypothetical protein [Balneolaceae bacterium]